MNQSRSQQYQYNLLRHQIEQELANEDFMKHLYHSVDGILRVILTMMEHRDKEDWTSHMVDEQGNPLLTKEEQQQFMDVLKDHKDNIVSFFEKDKQEGGDYVPDVSTLSGLSDDFLKKKTEQVTKMEEESDDSVGMDDIYTKFVKRIRQVDSVVNDYASKYGVLKLEKEYDLQPDIRIVPEAAASAISQGVMALSTSAGYPIPADTTMYVLSKIKIPFRTIVFSIYIILDIARMSMAFAGRDTSRKILSVVLSLLELLRGDWKKAILTFMGYYGTTPLLYGQLGKVFLTAFRMFSPQLQDSFIFGSLDATKSFIIGLLLSIFQVTAPEEVRLPLIASLEKIAQKKAEMDGLLQDANLSARPDYLSPTFEDLNNIQAVMSDQAYLCSCEFGELVQSVNQSAIIRAVLQLLRIPVTKEFIELKCGKEPCQPFVTKVVQEAKAQQEEPNAQEEEPKALPKTNQKAGRILHTIRQSKKNKK
jgi:hypothetical protein